MPSEKTEAQRGEVTHQAHTAKSWLAASSSPHLHPGPSSQEKLTAWIFYPESPLPLIYILPIRKLSTKAQSHLPKDIHLEAGIWPQASLFLTPYAISPVPTLGSEAGSVCPSRQTSLQPLLRLFTLVYHEVAIPRSPAAPAPPELSSSSERRKDRHSPCLPGGWHSFGSRLLPG